MRLTETFARFVRSEQAGGALLLTCTAAALAIANSRWGASYTSLWHASVAGLTLEHWINDGLIALFFSQAGRVIALLKRAVHERFANRCAYYVHCVTHRGRKR